MLASSLARTRNKRCLQCVDYILGVQGPQYVELAFYRPPIGQQSIDENTVFYAVVRNG